MRPGLPAGRGVNARRTCGDAAGAYLPVVVDDKDAVRSSCCRWEGAKMRPGKLVAESMVCTIQTLVRDPSYSTISRDEDQAG
jgi:hypothetical protein